MKNLEKLAWVGAIGGLAGSFYFGQGMKEIGESLGVNGSTDLNCFDYEAGKAFLASYGTMIVSLIYVFAPIVGEAFTGRSEFWENAEREMEETQE